MKEITQDIIKNIAYAGTDSIHYTPEIIKQIVEHSRVNYNLEKEIAYAKWKIEQYEDKPAYAEQELQWSYCLATLQQIQGTHSHDAEYDDTFEQIWNDQS